MKIQIIYGPSIDDGWKSWILRVGSIASEKTVYDGEAEYVGESLCLHELSIVYCPFCGEKLEPVPA